MENFAENSKHPTNPASMGRSKLQSPKPISLGEVRNLEGRDEPQSPLPIGNVRSKADLEGNLDQALHGGKPVAHTVHKMAPVIAPVTEQMQSVEDRKGVRHDSPPPLMAQAVAPVESKESAHLKTARPLLGEIIWDIDQHDKSFEKQAKDHEISWIDFHRAMIALISRHQRAYGNVDSGYSDLERLREAHQIKLNLHIALDREWRETTRNEMEQQENELKQQLQEGEITNIGFHHEMIALIKENMQLYARSDIPYIELNGRLDFFENRLDQIEQDEARREAKAQSNSSSSFAHMLTQMQQPAGAAAGFIENQADFDDEDDEAINVKPNDSTSSEDHYKKDSEKEQLIEDVASFMAEPEDPGDQSTTRLA